MARRKVRSISLTIEFTMSRQGEAKGDEAWTNILKRIQAALGEKYDVERLIISRAEEPPEHAPDDKVFEAGWSKGYWESWYEYSGQKAEDQRREEEQAAEAAQQGDITDMDEAVAETTRESGLEEDLPPEGLEELMQTPTVLDDEAQDAEILRQRAAQVEDENTEAALEDEALDRAEAAEHERDEP